ncbi:MAG: prepilin-type N-terminal cleavage/methylation domain-containing protein [Prochlorococcaceae cyanobacterium]
MASSTNRYRLLLHLLNKRSAAAGPGTQGFTLIELLVVIVILGVLGAVGYGAYINQLARANLGTAQVAATAAAKNCAALLATGEETAYTASIVNTDQVTLTPSDGAGCVTGDVTFQATAGAGTNSRSAEALKRADGSVGSTT